MAEAKSGQAPSRDHGEVIEYLDLRVTFSLHVSRRESRKEAAHAGGVPLCPETPSDSSASSLRSPTGSSAPRWSTSRCGASRDRRHSTWSAAAKKSWTSLLSNSEFNRLKG